MVFAFEQGHSDQVATAAQTQELLRQAFGDHSKSGGLRGTNGGGESYQVMVIPKNATFPDEDLYEPWEDVDDDDEEETTSAADVERRDQWRQNNYKCTCHDPMTDQASRVMPNDLH